MRLLLLLIVRLFEFSLLVALGMVSEITADFLECMAHDYRTGWVHPFDFSHDKGLIFALGFAVALVIGGLLCGLLGQEKLLKDFKEFDFKNQKITIIAALIVAALAVGYFYPPLCGEKTSATAITHNEEIRKTD
jgi:hypothetical protein